MSSSINTVSLFEAYHLQDVFNKDNYKGNCRIFPYAIVHYLIALDQPHDTLADKVKKLKGEINLPYSTHALTSLHVATIKNSREAVLLLLSHGADMRKKDGYGFTPWMHTALLANGSGIKLLFETAGYRPDRAEQRQWDTLSRILHTDTHETIPSRILYRKTLADDAKPLDFETMRHELHVEQYTDKVLFSKDHLDYLWKVFFIQGCHERQVLFFQDIADTPPTGRLCISNASRTLCEGKQVSLYAASDFAAGDVIDQYAGFVQKDFAEYYRTSDKCWTLFEQLVQHPVTDGDYCMALPHQLEVNAETVGNALRFSNDGWPVVDVKYVGVGQLKMYAIQPIKSGEEITWDYGAGYASLKWASYRLLHKEKMDAFFKKYASLDILLEQLKESTRRVFQLDLKKRALKSVFMNEFLKRFDYLSKIIYLYNTPSALMYLCLRHTVQAKELLHTLQQNVDIGKQVMVEDRPCHFIWTAILLDYLQKVQEEMLCVPKDTCEHLARYFEEEILEKMAVPKAVRCLYELKIALTTHTLDAFFKTDWVEKLTDFDWKNDPQNTLCSYSSEYGFTLTRQQGILIQSIPPLCEFLKGFTKIAR